MKIIDRIPKNEQYGYWELECDSVEEYKEKAPEFYELVKKKKTTTWVCTVR